MTPQALVVLANLGRPRRFSRAAAPASDPVLPTAGAASEQLASLIARPVTDDDLPALRRVQQVATEAADAVLAGQAPNCAALNALAGDSSAHVELVVTNETLEQWLVWHDPSLASGLARRLVEELAALEANRLRRCARSGCNLIFYDTTRSRTRRWHAEDPCGWRERQHHRRSQS